MKIQREYTMTKVSTILAAECFLRGLNIRLRCNKIIDESAFLIFFKYVTKR